ncbi:transcriptional repressor [Mucilaginibacter endophyticus]|uniref:transcriptional repressor n=1 Tax=Mucilaginibacter endophyticus TaxID=2675003 RepID=UPI000E0D2C96|nr:transcriptional repressor [Mucilaginibacter endophyticus]
MHDLINEIKLRPISQVILKYLMDHREPVDAETIWLDVKANGATFSIGSIYGHLKRMEDAGIIVKVPKTDRKALYQYVSSNA